MSIKQDATGVRTAQDLERKYDLSSIAGMKKAVEQSEIGIYKTNKELEEFINTTTVNLEEVQNQVDSSITTWFYSGAPTLENNPASEWTTYEEKNNHKGDMYYDYEKGKGYRFNYIDETFCWSEVIDTNVIESLAVANSQRDTDDHKRTIFLTQPKTPYEVGDIWVKDESSFYRSIINRAAEDKYNKNDWINASDYTDEIAAKNTTALLSSYKTIVNTKLVTDSLLAIDGDSITMRVTKNEESIETKSRVFLEEPTPPYNKGDVYYKTYYDSTMGMNQTKMYVCQVDKDETESYSEGDFSLQPTYASKAELKVTSDGLSSVVDKIGDRSESSTTIAQDISNLYLLVSDVTDLTTSASTTNGFIPSSDLKNINESIPISIKIHPIEKNISYLYSNTGLFPDNKLYPKVKLLKFTNTTDNTMYFYEIPDDLLYFDEETFDEFELDYETNMVKIIKNCKYNEDGTVSKRSSSKVDSYDFPLKQLSLTTGDYQVELVGYNTGYLFVRLMGLNAYTANYVTKVQLQSGLKATSDSVKTYVDANVTELGGEIKNVSGEVELKVGKNDNNQIVSMLNASANEINVSGNRFVLDSTNFKVAKDGTITAKNGSFTGEVNATSGSFKGKVTATSGSFTGDVTGSSISGGSINIGNGNFIVDSSGKLTSKGGKFIGDITGSTIKGSSMEVSLLNGSYTKINNSGVEIYGSGGSQSWTGNMRLKVSNADGDYVSISPYYDMLDWYANPIKYYKASENVTYMPIMSSSVGKINHEANGTSGKLRIDTGLLSYYINTYISDTKLKENIKDTEVSNALDIINNINHISYDWKNSKLKHVKLGYSANQLKELEDSLAVEVKQNDKSEYDSILQIDTTNLFPYITKSIQELSSIVEQQQQQINELKEEINVLKESSI